MPKITIEMWEDDREWMHQWPLRPLRTSYVNCFFDGWYLLPDMTGEPKVLPTLVIGSGLWGADEELTDE